MILIDNYDSFTYNVVQYLREIGAEPLVIKNDEMDLSELKKLDFESIIISPGPSNPDEAGISLSVIEEFYKTKKILGICLGHQCIAQYFGAKITKYENPVHGKNSEIFYVKEEPLFLGMKQGFEATRYHSLIVDADSVNHPLTISATTHDNVIMSLRHCEYKVFGVQFHPEAILTQDGKKLFKNFIDI